MKLFVWDFHGTLEQGNELAVQEISNIVLERFGFEQRFTEELSVMLYGKKWFEYFEYLLPDQPKEKWFELQEACFEYSIAHPEIVVKYIKLVDGAGEVLEAISKKHDQIVISNTKPRSLEMFLEAVGIAGFFPEGKAFATDAHVKDHTKHEVLEKYLKGKVFDEIVVIGDSPKDVELGKSVGATTYLYTHPGLEFKDCDPDHRINILSELLEVI